MAPFNFVSLLFFVAWPVVQILNCVVFGSKFLIILDVNFIPLCNLSNVKISINVLYYLVKVTLLSNLNSVMASINNLYYLVKITLLSLNAILLCNLSNVMIKINNLYLVKLTLPCAAALCEVPNSNPAAFLSSSGVAAAWSSALFLLCCCGSKFPIALCACLTLLHNLSNVAMAIIFVSNNNLCSVINLTLLSVVQLPLVPNSKLFAFPLFPNSNFLFCSKFQLFFAGLLLLFHHGSVCPLSQL